MNFVTVDKVGEDEEKEAVSTRSRGRDKKKPRQTPGDKHVNIFFTVTLFPKI